MVGALERGELSFVSSSLLLPFWGFGVKQGQTFLKVGKIQFASKKEETGNQNKMEKNRFKKKEEGVTISLVCLFRKYTKKLRKPWRGVSNSWIANNQRMGSLGEMVFCSLFIKPTKVVTA